MDSSDQQRRRLTGALFAGNALASTAFLGAVTVASLAAEELTGSPRLAGVPNAIGTVGTALGASLITLLSARRGRRPAFVFGFSVSALGAAVGAASLFAVNLPALLAGMFAMGFGRSVNQLARFAAGDLWTAERRASAIGFVVWAATIASVLGPLLIVPAGRLGKAYLGAELAGPFVVSGVGFALAALWYFATLRPEPLTLAASDDAPPAAAEEDAAAVPLWTLIRRPTVRLALLVLMASQFVMILVMTMTPVHIRAHGHGLPLVSGVMMAHTLGMYAISPLTGYLVDWFGARRLIAAGSAVLVAASLLAASELRTDPLVLTLALLLLGVGWNFGFVAGSAIVQKGLAVRESLRIQGVADSLTWISGGVAALGSGFVMAAGSFSGLALLGAGMSLAPLVALRLEARPAR